MDYLVNRGYELNFLKTQIRCASDISRNDALKPKPKQQTDTVPFVITYNPALPNISRIIHKHSNVLYSSGRCKNVFTNLPLVAYRRCKNISDILVRAKLPLIPTNLGLHPARFGAIKLAAPSVLLLRMAVINILFVVLHKRLKSNHILLVKLLMLFT